MGAMRRSPDMHVLTENDLAVIRLALETQERVMTERGAEPAAIAARQVRAKLARTITTLADVRTPSG